ncbi:hypothetical protein F4604DRAFT_1733097 [Suillus subluteus]|nr:hypothetical protein F4604DRAFT_1733097 [Suillus subluteus]
MFLLKTAVSGRWPMPTTTMTMATVSMSDMLPYKPSSKGSSSTEATLQSLYNCAARAFLHRDITVTFTLLSAAFALLPPGPTSLCSFTRSPRCPPEKVEHPSNHPRNHCLLFISRHR